MSETRSPRPKRTPQKRNTDMENYRLSEEGKLLWEAFEKVKPRMCGQAAKLTIEAMEEHREYRDRTGPSSHPFYARIKGKGRIDDPERYYYPYLLVIQTIWPESHHVQKIAVAFSRYWGVPDLWRGPEHYPMLNDRDREMELFMGRKPREPKARQDESSTGNCEDNGEGGEGIKQEGTEEEGQLQEQEQTGEEEAESEEQEEQREEDDEDTIADTHDIDTINDIDKLDEIEATLEIREKELVIRMSETKDLMRKVQERKREHYKEKSDRYKRNAEELQKRLEEERRVAEHWAIKEREYIKKLERSSATSSAISPPPEQENERPAKRQRVVESEE